MVQGKDIRPTHGEICGSHCISWKAIFTGALVGIGLSFLLNLFSFAIGLTVFTPSKEGLMTLAIGGFIGMLVGVIATMYTAGWVAGYLARPHCINRDMGALYGFAAWVIILIVSVLMATQISNFIASNYSAIANPKPMELRMSENSENIIAGQPKTNPNYNNNNNGQAVVSTEKAANTAGLSLLLTFVIFLVGALSSCFGGYFGLRSICNKSSRL